MHVSVNKLCFLSTCMYLQILLSIMNISSDVHPRKPCVFSVYFNAKTLSCQNDFFSRGFRGYRWHNTCGNSGVWVGLFFVQKTEIPGRWGVFQTIPSVEEVWILFGTTLWGEGTVLLKWFSLQVPPKLFTMSNVLKCISMLNVWKSLMFFRILVHIHVSCKTTSAQLAATFVRVT